MTTRSKYVFVTFPEFVEWLRETAKDFGLSVFLSRGPSVALEHWDGSRKLLAGSRRVYDATHPTHVTGVRADEVKPGLQGWVQIDIPRRQGARLFATQIAAKSDWFDAKQQKVIDNPASLHLFQKLWSNWRNHFRFPVWVKNKKTGENAPYRSIGFSSGAAEWYRGGRELCQEGVDNIEYMIPDEAP